MYQNATMLDNPVWWSLVTHHRDVARSHGTACMMDADYGPFAALAGASPKEIDDFLTLVAGSEIPLVTAERTCLFGAPFLPTDMGVQMVAERVVLPTADPDIVDLGEDDAHQMLELARHTRPGPFEWRTHQLGDFIGVKHHGRLIAMAGQRFKLPGYTEISAVCVAPEYQSRGLGTALVLHMAARIRAEGDEPFLHTYASNHGAIALYQRLGFRLLTSMQLTCWDAEKIAATRAQISCATADLKEGRAF